MTYKKQILKGGSLSSTYKFSKEGSNFVRKKINHHKDREYGFIRWYSQIKKHQRLKQVEEDLFPDIYKFEIDNDFSSVDIEWLEGFIDLKTYLTENLLSKKEISLIVKLIFNAFERIHRHKLSKICNAGKLYFREEVAQKIIDASNLSKDFKNFINYPKFNYFGKDLTNTCLNLDKLKKFFGELQLDEQLTLGNPTMENIMYNPNSKKIKFIDLYEESMIDSKYLDYSMILQCSSSHYGLINDREVFVKDEIVTHNIPIPESLLLFSQIFENSLPLDSLSTIKIFEATQFIRMLPFKILAGDVEKAKFFYTHACFLISRVL